MKRDRAIEEPAVSQSDGDSLFQAFGLEMNLAEHAMRGEEIRLFCAIRFFSGHSKDRLPDAMKMNHVMISHERTSALASPGTQQSLETPSPGHIDHSDLRAAIKCPLVIRPRAPSGLSVVTHQGDLKTLSRLSCGQTGGHDRGATPVRIDR